MKRYFIVDWKLSDSTPTRHVYRCGWRALIRWRLGLSLMALVLAGLLYHAFGSTFVSNQRASAWGDSGASSAAVSSSLSPTEQKMRAEIGEQRFAQYLRERQSRGLVSQAELHKQGRGLRVFHVLGAALYWTALGCLAGGGTYLLLSSLWCRVRLDADGDGQLAVSFLNLWPARQALTKAEIGGIVYGVRETIIRSGRRKPVHDGWYWFIDVLGRPRSDVPNPGVLAELIVSHQDHAPNKERARIPARVSELLSWLKARLECRSRGPVMVADRKWRQDQFND